MPEVTAPSSSMLSPAQMQETITLIDSVVGEANNLGHPRSPVEAIDFCIAVVKLLQAKGVDVVPTLTAIKPLVQRATGEK